MVNKRENLKLARDLGVGDALASASKEATILKAWTTDLDEKDRQLEAIEGNLILTVNRSLGTADTLFVSVNERDTDRMIFRLAIDRTKMEEADVKSFPWKVKMDVRSSKTGWLGTGGYGEFIL